MAATISLLSVLPYLVFSRKWVDLFYLLLCIGACLWYVTMSDSDGLSFIVESDSDDAPIMETIVNNDSGKRAMELALKIIQLRQDSATPSSSQRPRKKKRYIRRDRQEAHDRLHRDYFAENAVYDETHFRRRFRMRKHLFFRIVDALSSRFEYFQLRFDGVGRRGLSPLTKCTAAMRMLAYGISADCVDEYLKIGESTALECMKNFAAGIIQVFGDEYLRKPTQTDVDRLLQVAEARDFPGMIGSIDCMHWEWKNCPSGWKGVFAKRIYRVPTLILEAVASYDLWIWHAFFGCPGSLNDINVLHRSDVFQQSYEDRAPKCEYVVNGHKYNIGYFLSDGIYPRWATFVKTIPHPQGPKARLFAERQESVRKDVGRAFGVLQSRFAIIRGPARNMDKAELGMIMKACIILHNMIVEDERDSYDLAYDYDDVEESAPQPNA